MTATVEIPQPFSNLQLELLKIYAMKVSEQDLLEIRRILGQYFADKASDLADEVWEKKNLNEKKLRSRHRRTLYKTNLNVQ